MKLLFIGDIFGRPGRRVLAQLLPALRSEVGADLVVANGENVAAGVGITRETSEECFAAGVDVITGGNHIWDKEEGIGAVERDERILRPVNYPPGTPGRGYGVFQAADTRVVVVSVLGRIFMQPFDDPFRALDAVLEKVAPLARVVFVDMHAEATSEKCALAWYLDGRVSAVVGTHTHVQTADERILPRGTAFLTDAGMTGPHDSIIGVRKELALRRMRAQMPVRFQPADGDLRLHGVVIEIDPGTGRASRIERIQRRWEE
jgi:2',3'-cyclic-nucleotide 2'-phosphodiesterase